MRYFYNEDNKNLEKWQIEAIKREEERIKNCKEAIKRFSAMLPYAKKSCEGVYIHLLGWDAYTSTRNAIDSCERMIKEAEKMIKDYSQTK